MARPKPHRILRQVFDLRLDIALDERGSIAALERTLSDLVQNRALSQVEALFDRLATPDTFVSIDRVELDLGRIEGPEWQQLLVEKLVANLEESVGRAEPAQSSEVQAVRCTQADSRRRQVLFLLEHGRLPWWGGDPEPDFVQALAQQDDFTHWPALRTLLSESGEAMTRLIYELDDVALERLAFVWGGLEHTRSVLPLLAPARGSAPALQQFRIGFWRAILAASLASETPAARGLRVLQRAVQLCTELSGARSHDRGHAPVPPSAARELERSPAAHTLPSAAGPLAIAARGTPGVNSIAADLVRRRVLPEPWQSWLESWTSDVAFAQMRGDSLPVQSVARLVPSGSGAHLVPREPLDQGTERTTRRSGALADGEPLFLRGAGAVLLHPFLEELFRSRELLEGRRFRDSASQHHAVRLVGHLSFAADQISEHELLLSKLLCGMRWEEPLSPSVITDVDREACAELLRAVLSHWRALKSSSPEWLRQGFFLRDGKLEPVDDAWKLTVERAAQDVLLGKLPWGIGVIRLPFMPSTLHVHWT